MAIAMQLASWYDRSICTVTVYYTNWYILWLSDASGFGYPEYPGRPESIMLHN